MWSIHMHVHGSVMLLLGQDLSHMFEGDLFPKSHSMVYMGSHKINKISDHIWYHLQKKKITFKPVTIRFDLTIIWHYNFVYDCIKHILSRDTQDRTNLGCISAYYLSNKLVKTRAWACIPGLVVSKSWCGSEVKKSSTMLMTEMTDVWWLRLLMIWADC